MQREGGFGQQRSRPGTFAARRSRHAQHPRMASIPVHVLSAAHVRWYCNTRIPPLRVGFVLEKIRPWLRTRGIRKLPKRWVVSQLDSWLCTTGTGFFGSETCSQKKRAPESGFVVRKAPGWLEREVVGIEPCSNPPGFDLGLGVDHRSNASPGVVVH